MGEIVKRYDIILYAAFFLLVLYLAYEILTLRTQVYDANIALSQRRHTTVYDNNSIHSLTGSYFPGFTFPFVDSIDTLTFPEANGKSFYIFVLFTPFDCPVCFKEIPLWNYLGNHLEFPVEVIGIIASETKEMASHFVTNNEILIPVLFDEKGELLDNLNILYSGLTPLKILTTSNGYILNISTTTYDDALEQTRYKDLLSQIALYDILNE